MTLIVALINVVTNITLNYLIFVLGYLGITTGLLLVGAQCDTCHHHTSLWP